jgi:hypothetical protein
MMINKAFSWGFCQVLGSFNARKHLSKLGSWIETFEYVMTYFNLPVPDGGLLYILKSLEMKI